MKGTPVIYYSLMSLLRNINQKKKDSSSIVDERYKNIDPKMIETIMNEILEQKGNLTFHDIAGLSHAKEVIHESVIMPVLKPQFFVGLRAPPKGFLFISVLSNFTCRLLLFGPPGTGKTFSRKSLEKCRNTFSWNLR